MTRYRDSCCERAAVAAAVETVERIDEDALAEAAESHPDLSVEDVFEESTRRQIRREDVTLDWDERE